MRRIGLGWYSTTSFRLKIVLYTSIIRAHIQSCVCRWHILDIIADRIITFEQCVNSHWQLKHSVSLTTAHLLVKKSHTPASQRVTHLLARENRFEIAAFPWRSDNEASPRLAAQTTGTGQPAASSDDLDTASGNFWKWYIGINRPWMSSAEMVTVCTCAISKCTHAILTIWQVAPI